MMFQSKIHWRTALFGDGHFLVHEAFSGLWHFLFITVLFLLWKLRCKFLSDQEIGSLFSFIFLWKDEVHHQLLEKRAKLFRDAHSFDPIGYFYFIFSLVILKKKL